MSSSYVKIIEGALGEVRKVAKRRRFNQTVELIIKLRDVDVKKPENRINLTVPLPNPMSKRAKVCVIASGATITAAREAGADLVITKMTSVSSVIRRVLGSLPSNSTFSWLHRI
jgi:LSU ribosomal protein L1P